MPSLKLSALRKEAAVVGGVLIAVAEILVQVFVSGGLHDVLVLALPVAGALGIRAHVTPISGALKKAAPALATAESIAAVLHPQLAKLDAPISRVEDVASRLEAAATAPAAPAESPPPTT